MRGIYKVELTSDADRDLRDIGGATERDLFGKLFRLAEADVRGETEQLDLHEAGKPVRKSWHVGNFAVVYHERLDAEDRRIAVVEAVVLTKSLDGWLARKAREAKKRDDAIAADEQQSRHE